MTSSAPDSKSDLRREVRARLRALTSARRAADSTRACALLRKQPLWQTARSLLFYAPMPEELDVWPLLVEALAERKIAALPSFDAGSKNYTACRIQDLAADVQPGSFGIREPAPHCAPNTLAQFDLILVPGVAFDLHRRRLGRGQGHYDQLLSRVRGTTCGVAFDEQIILDVPVEPHDVHLNSLLTPTHFLEF